MLRSIGLLRNDPCPYFVAGLCDRPHCFYSHEDRDIQAAQNNALNKQVTATSTEDEETPSTDVAPSGSEVNELVEKVSDTPKRRFSDEVSEERKSKKLKSVETSCQADDASVSNIEIKSETNMDCQKSPAAGPSGSNGSGPDNDKGNSSEQKAEQSKSHNSNSRSHHQHSKGSSKESTSSKPSKTEPRKARQGQESTKEKAVTKIDKHEYHTHHSKSYSKNKEGTIDTRSDTKSNHGDEKASISNNLDFSKDDSNPNQFLLPEDNDSEDDPEEIALECLEMFKNYKADEATKRADPAMNSKVHDRPVPDTAIGKKRVAHPGADEHTAGPYVAKPRLNPKEVLQQRIIAQRARSDNTIISTPIVSVCTSSSTTPPQESESHLVPGKRKRISHVPNVSSLLKPSIVSSSSKPEAPAKPTVTVVQTIQKGQTRVARLPPPQISVPSPVISVESIKKCKVPVSVRQKILDQIYQECLKIYPNPKDASARALAEELELTSRCSSKPVYICAGTNTITRLRKETAAGPTEAATGSRSLLSHTELMEKYTGLTNVSWSYEKKVYPSVSGGTPLYQALKKYLLTSTDLENNGFPLPDPSEERGKAIAKPRKSVYSTKASSDPFERICDRCQSAFRVDRDGLPIGEVQCFYHHGRKYNRRVNGITDGYYTCCSGDSTATGCAFASCHVFQNTSRELRGFVTAVQGIGSDDNMGKHPWDIMGVDCEMIYTTNGSELARATFVGSDSKILYDELVKPIHPVLDYNTRYSGITEEMLRNTNTTLTDVQAVLLTRLRPNSILIGHSLESDLIALKLIHQTVIDTSVMFPHKMGPPYKRALRNLSSELLKKIIQENEGGHDSAEDARTALELVVWKANQDLKIPTICKSMLK